MSVTGNLIDDLDAENIKLRSLLAAALPCVEAMARDTRLQQADGDLLVVLAQIKEMVA